MKVIKTQVNITNKSQQVSPFPASDHTAAINKACQTQDINNTNDPQKKCRLGMVSKIFYSRACTGFTAPTSPLVQMWIKVSKGANIRNRYNQVPHLNKDTNGKVTNSQFDTTNESQEVSPFPEGDHKAHINRHAQRHSKHNTEKKTHKTSTKEDT